MKAQSPSRPQPKIGKATGFRSARQFPWTKEEDALLGNLTDREVAEKLNRTLGAVRDRRKFLGKPAVGHALQPFRMEREPRDRYARLFVTANKGIPAWHGSCTA